MSRLRDFFVALLVGALVFLVLLAHGALGATQKPLHRGSHGQRVKDIQWLLSDHKPGVYPFKTYTGKIDGIFGAQTAQSVLDMKWKLGYPKSALKPIAGRQLFEFLTGKRQRPLGWIGRASKRVKRPMPGPKTSCEADIVRVARAELARRVQEVPLGSNDGPRVHVYQSVTGAYRLAWCVSFAQYVWKTAGVGTIANRSAGVFYTVQWAHDHEMLNARPRPGAMVAYLEALGHMGIVTRVTTHGFFTAEGNSGPDRVVQHFHPIGYQHTVFIYPRCPLRSKH